MPPDPLASCLLGIALGDALALPAEGMTAPAIARRFGTLDRFRLLGRTGFVSDDTEQSALVAQSIARHPDDPAACAAAFRRSLLGWFARLPWGVGLATVKACIKIALGISPSGVRSAGNGAAMRSAIIGVFFRDDPARRLAFGRALAEVTHRDPRAVEGALYVAEVAAGSARGLPPADSCRLALSVVSHPDLARALDLSFSLASDPPPLLDAARRCGTSGYIVHTLSFATSCFLLPADSPLQTLALASSAGGDTDSIGAILGSWLGPLHGEAALPAPLLAQIHDGPFGPSHLRALAACLSSLQAGRPAPIPRYSPLAALARNLALYPVILSHGLRRLLPF